MPGSAAARPPRHPRLVARLHDPVRVPPPVALRTTIDPSDLRDASALGYGQALTALLRAKAAWLRACGTGQPLERARAARVLQAETAVADRAYDELVKAAEAAASD